jgi:hypothetical protein
MAEY